MASPVALASRLCKRSLPAHLPDNTVQKDDGYEHCEFLKVLPMGSFLKLPVLLFLAFYRSAPIPSSTFSTVSEGQKKYDTADDAQ